ncbi:MAG TPA: hypothetical protein VNU84_06450 [Candidatus Acidoferrum sp.]|jgi:hypothetical protein|nr:hypothetical protein [Candidatus Acidoferrum sp.]
MPAIDTPPPPSVANVAPALAAQPSETGFPGQTRGFWATLEALPHEPGSWGRSGLFGLGALVALWAVLFRWTWATWGSVTIDSGREMYVPAVLSQGQVLYRDISYAYTPLAPYFNALLFRMFGIHLEILYWAGALAAFGSAALLFFTGIRLSCRLAGWTAAAVLLVEAFRRSLFSFPLPYSYAAVYGCLVACLFLWLLVRMSTSANLLWKFAIGMTAATALLLKLEFGAACYLVLALDIVAQSLRERSWMRFFQWIGAILPGLAVCAAVGAWMISIRGVWFITHENIDSWASSYFMRTYGKLWLRAGGIDWSRAAIESAAIGILAFGVLTAGLRWFLGRMNGKVRQLSLWIALAGVALVITDQSSPTHFVRIFGLRFLPRETLGVVAFPSPMAVLVAGAALAAWWYFLRNDTKEANPAMALALTFSAVFCARTLLDTKSYGYSTYYDGPELLCFLILVSLFVAPLTASKRIRLVGTSLLCAMCFLSAVLDSNISDAYFKTFVPLVTDRGTIRLPAGLAANYQATIAFMKNRAAAGQSVMSIPEDTSLYFFSGTKCPTRACIFVPGVVAPGEMTDEVIAQLEKNRPQFLIWSNRKYPEYGAPRFGTDFDVPIGDYLRAHYRPLGSLVPFDPTQWGAIVWEKISDTSRR